MRDIVEYAYWSLNFSPVCNTSKQELSNVLRQVSDVATMLSGIGKIFPQVAEGITNAVGPEYIKSKEGRRENHLKVGGKEKKKGNVVTDDDRKLFDVWKTVYSVNPPKVFWPAILPRIRTMQSDGFSYGEMADMVRASIHVGFFQDFVRRGDVPYLNVVLSKNMVPQLLERIEKGQINPVEPVTIELDLESKKKRFQISIWHDLEGARQQELRAALLKTETDADLSVLADQFNSYRKSVR